MARKHTVRRGCEERPAYLRDAEEAITVGVALERSAFQRGHDTVSVDGEEVEDDVILEEGDEVVITPKAQKGGHK